MKSLEPVPFTVRLPRGIYEQVVAESKETGITMNKLITFAIINFLHPGTLERRSREQVDAAAERFRQAKAELTANAATDEEVERFLRGEEEAAKNLR